MTTKPPTKRRSRNFDEAKTRLIDRLSGAEIFQLSSEETHQKFLSLREDFNLTNLQWQYLRGWYDARVHEWYKYDFVFCYIIDGQPVKAKWNNLTEEQRKLVMSDEIDRGHFWIKDNGEIGKRWF